MSIVPLKLEESVVATQDAFQDKGTFEGKAVLIFNLDKTQLVDTGTSNVSYDLRVGSEYRRHQDAEKTELPDKGVLLLRPGNAVLIQTEEVVFLPRTMFGYVVPKVSLLQQGISNTLSKVDPGYNGPLIVTLFNLGKNDLELKRGERFCSIVFHSVSDGALLYNRPGKRITGTVRQDRWVMLLAWVEAHKTPLTIVSGGLGGAIFTALLALILYFFRSPTH